MSSISITSGLKVSPSTDVGFGGDFGVSTCSPTGMRSVGSRCATGSELDEAPGDVSSASRSTCTIPLSLAVAFVAVRFSPRVGR